MPKKLDDCVKSLIAKGRPEGAAWAICKSQLAKSKNEDGTDCNCPMVNKMPSAVNRKALGIFDPKLKIAEEDAAFAEYQGRTVALNKPFRTPSGPKKFAVYVKNSSGKVVIVRFGDPNMEIKRDDPERRKSFRARHKCSQQKDPTTPAYWSCKMWSNANVSDLT